MPARGQSKGLDPHHFQTGLGVCTGGGDAYNLDEDIARIGDNVTLSRSALDELAANNKCRRIEADNVKPINFSALASTFALQVVWGDGKQTGWVGMKSYLAYMRFHVVRLPEKKMERIQ